MITRYKAADPLDPTSQAEYKVLAAGAQRYWHGTRAAFEQVKNSIPNNTMICITDDNDAPSDNAPIGSVFAYYGSTSPDGYLICDGSTFDTSLYPDLYLFLGSDTLPDLRECTLVGVGQNTTHTIAAHDEYTLGQFKDDQLQSHTHKTIHGTLNSPAGLADTGKGSDTNNDNYISDGVGRFGTTTHGKQVGVNYIIKATSNMSKSDASALLAQVIQHMMPDWANAVPITMAQVVAGYTAPSDGMIVGYGTSTENAHVGFKVNNVVVSYSDYYPGIYAAYGNTQVPVNKGDIFKSDGALYGATFHFVPHK